MPAAALLYPLNVKSQLKQSRSIVRSILNIDEARQCRMILAGDIPEGSVVQLMMTNVDNIANASERAARQALALREKKPEVGDVGKLYRKKIGFRSSCGRRN